MIWGSPQLNVRECRIGDHERHPSWLPRGVEVAMRVWQRRCNSVEIVLASSKCAIEDLAKPKICQAR